MSAKISYICLCKAMPSSQNKLGSLLGVGSQHREEALRLGLTPEVTLQPLVGSTDSRLDKVSLGSLAELVCLKKGMLKDRTSIILAQQARKDSSLHRDGISDSFLARA